MPRSTDYRDVAFEDDVDVLFCEQLTFEGQSRAYWLLLKLESLLNTSFRAESFVH